MVCEDAQRGKRNLSMAWIDVAKAYDSVDHGWLSEMFTLQYVRYRYVYLQYVLRKDCRKVMRCVLCCSYCA